MYSKSNKKQSRWNKADRSAKFSPGNETLQFHVFLMIIILLRADMIRSKYVENTMIRNKRKPQRNTKMPCCNCERWMTAHTMISS